MVLAATVNADVYKKYITFGESEYARMTTKLLYGLTPETEAFTTQWCDEEYWFDAGTMAQVAADALGYPVAVYQTNTLRGNLVKPHLHLPLDTPAQGALHKPLILHLVGNHYYSLHIKPSIHIEWPLFIIGIVNLGSNDKFPRTTKQLGGTYT